MRKNRKHPVYSLDEKIRIINEQIANNIRTADIIRKYDINKSVYNKWKRKFFDTGTISDNRGKSSKGKGRTKKLNPDNMSRDELIEYVKACEDIKKSAAYLNKQKKNI